MKKVITLTESDLIKIVKRVVKENRHEEKDIFISKGFKGVRMEFGGESASPSDIIELYNAYVEEGIPLVKYLGRDIFLNANDDEIDKYSVLDELNYAILGEEDEEDYDDEEDDNNRQSFDDTGRHLGWFNPKRW
jgi:hypothetical protein